MESLHYLLMKSHTLLNRQITAGASRLGYSPGQPKVLEYLAGHEGSDQKTIAAYCEIEQATVGSILLRMEAAGLIERRQAPGNRRSLFVYLTDKGRKAAGEMGAIFTRVDRQAEAGLTPDEAAQLKALLEKVCQAMEKKGEV